jgi:hypothetical protein
LTPKICETQKGRRKRGKSGTRWAKFFGSGDGEINKENQEIREGFKRRKIAVNPACRKGTIKSTIKGNRKGYGIVGDEPRLSSGQILFPLNHHARETPIERATPGRRKPLPQCTTTLTEDRQG